jgi:hypothetical protein
LWPPRWRPSSFRCGATAKAHRIAANIAKLRGLLRGKPGGCLDETGPHARETKIAAFFFQH